MRTAFFTLLAIGTAVAQYKPPRTADGKPDLQGIWEPRNAAAFDVSEIAEGNAIPYLPEALEREQKASRVDPIAHCGMPGVPRINYLPFPFQIVQRPGAVILLYEYLHNQRIIPTNPRPHLDGIDFWLGDSVGHWEGDTLVVDVTDLGDKTWLDSARHTHSDALHVVERYTRTGPNTITYQATLEDPKTYAKPWTIRMPLHRNNEPGFELREQECTEGDDGRAIHPLYRPAPKGDPLEFVRQYPGKGRSMKAAWLIAMIAFPAFAQSPSDFEGYWQPRASGAAYSILPHPGGFFLGAESKTGIVEGGEIPYQPWAAQQVKELTQHMELDPTGHCHYEGVPHAMYFGFQIYVTPKQVLIMHENMHAWRIIYTDGSPHPKDYSAWMGDSRGHWEGNTLVVDVANNNDKSVFDMAGHFHSDALHVVERFTMLDHDTINYEATLDDPKVFTKPWKMKFPLKRAKAGYQFMESGCFEGERDAVHLVEGLATIPKDHYTH